MAKPQKKLPPKQKKSVVRNKPQIVRPPVGKPQVGRPLVGKTHGGKPSKPLAGKQQMGKPQAKSQIGKPQPGKTQAVKIQADRTRIMLGTKIKAFFQKHNPRMYIGAKIQKMHDGIYYVSDKIKYKIAETSLVLNNPFSAQFYQDRCNIQ